MDLTELQRVIIPTEKCFGPTSSYLRKTGGFYCQERDAYVFFKGVEFNTLTFYNAFSIGKWQLNTCVESIYLRLRGEGKVIIDVLYAKPGNHEILLSRRTTILTNNAHTDIEISVMDPLESGLVYFNIIPLEDGILTYSGFWTNSRPENEIKLGLVITHFNRQAQVNSAVARIRTGLLQEEEFRDSIHLLVVDNSRNSGIDSSGGIELIPNDNLGGAGGFSRGLLELVTDGTFTHCLFMDDDASCEIESLRRTFRVMQFSTQNKLAIAGTLLEQDAPSKIYEKGAIFDGLCRKLHPELDISEVDELLEAESVDEQPNYGGWWFFCFKLTDVSHFPFPFFVRGDDTTFSMVNKFSIMTMNGIASYGERFESKNSIMPTYLDTRAHLVKQIFILDHGRVRVMKGLLRFFLMSIFSYNYGCARAVTMAAGDLAKGTRFFIDNMSMESRFPVIKQLAANEKCRDVIPERECMDFPEKKYDDEGILRKMLRFLTINGLLIPGFLLRNRIAVQNMGFRASFREIFGYSKVYYRDEYSNNGYMTSIDRREILSCLREFLPKAAYLVWHFSAIKSEYKRNMPEIMSREFWQNVYNDEAQ